MYNYYSYFEILQDLTLVKKSVIACIHHNILIIKLRSSGTNISISYLRICDHAIVLSQELGLLLNLLLSNNIQLYDIIRFVWLGKHPHTNNNLQYFGKIKKAKIFQVLL